MDKWERSLHALGERLHMPVYKIKEEMPLREFVSWMVYFGEQNQETTKGPELDVTAMSPEKLKEMFP